MPINPIKRPKLVAGAVAAIAAVGVWFGMKLGDLNFGTGGGGGIGLSGASRPGDLARPDKTPESAKDGASANAQGNGPQRGDVLEIVIDGRGYALRQTGETKDDYVPKSLTEVVELAKGTAGNRDGVRVRVYRRGSALPTAEEALQQALADAGLTETSVQMMDGQLE